MKIQKIVLGIFLFASNAFGNDLEQGAEVNETRISPVVFKFDAKNELRTIPLKYSRVKFDLNGDGTKEKTGWISGKEGFLVLDINQNGLVDSGRELFGNHSGWGKRSYKNGYLAMEHFDTNKDGFLDRRDIVFYNLKLWFDLNQNGISEGNELKTLPGMGITRMSTKPQTFEKDPIAGKNFIPLASRFWGPKLCGKAGCSTFDVFFLTEKLKKVQLGQI